MMCVAETIGAREAIHLKKSGRFRSSCLAYTPFISRLMLGQFEMILFFHFRVRFEFRLIGGLSSGDTKIGDGESRRKQCFSRKNCRRSYLMLWLAFRHFNGVGWVRVSSSVGLRGGQLSDWLF